jgi:signal transduction histidine kinase
MARRIDGIVAFLIKSEPRRPPSAWALAFDSAIAVAATVYALTQAVNRQRPVATLPKATKFYPVTLVGAGAHSLIGYAAVLHGQLVDITKYLPPDIPPLPLPSLLYLAAFAAMTLPLAARRRYPTLTGCVILGVILASSNLDWRPTIIFATGILAAYSAVAYARFRQLAVIVVLAGAIAITVTFPNTMPDVPERYTAAIVAAAAVAAGLGIREWRRRAGDSATRLRRAEAEHAAATRRAIAVERARIAAELHDVVTHNVSVMVVQAGAARSVLDTSLGDAREALLAIEASGRNAMTELRHLLGLLAPPCSSPCSSGSASDDAMLRPSPGLAQVTELVAGVRAAGLPVALSITGTRRDLPPGLDLAVYRVVQEALTNVIKHADQAPTTLCLDYRAADLVIDVSNEASAGPRHSDEEGNGRGLIGLRERIAIYGGDLDVGPRPGGGWRLRATIPLEHSSELALVQT